MLIRCVSEFDPLPRATVLVLTCDGEHDDLFPPVESIFIEDGFTAQHAMAMRHGWREAVSNSKGRQWFGPCCSGKDVKTLY